MAIFSQNAIKQGFFARQHRIGGKPHEVLTTFYAKQTQFSKNKMNVNLCLTNDYEKNCFFRTPKKQSQSNPIFQ